MNPPNYISQTNGPRAFLFGVVLLVVTGCSSMNQNLKSRELVLERRWAQSTLAGEHLGYRHSHQMVPVLTEDLVIQGNSTDGIVAFDRRTAGQEWELRVPNGMASGVQIQGERAFFGASDGQFYAVELGTGRAAWSFPTRVENLAAPLATPKLVYFLSGNDTVYALNTENGQQKWIYARSSQVDLSVRGGTRPALFGNTLFVGFSDGYLAALHSEDGSLMWERQLGTSPKFKDIDSSPYVDEKHIYVSSFDNYLYCLSRTDGQLIWRLEDGGAFPVTINGNMLYYSTSNGKVKAVNRFSGEALWTIKLPEGIATQPVLFEGNLLYGESDGALRVVDAKNGSPITQYHTGRGINAAPSVDPKTGQVYVVTNEGNLFELAFRWVTDSERRPIRHKF
jgi:outer membrane protein assembly factor BamB